MVHAHPRWITKAIDTHSEYETRIAFPQHQWLRETASMYTVCTLTELLFFFKQLTGHI